MDLLRPAPGEVRTWIIRSGSHPPDFEGEDPHRILSPEENARAGRFSDGTSRERFVTGRTHLRGILAACLDMAPEDVVIRTSRAGKPLLGTGRAGSSELHFSVSHSGDFVAIALATSGPVGIDIEGIRPFDGMDAVARRVLSEGERRVLELLPPKLRGEAFFGAWTRKEAVLKAMGTGFGYPAERVEVGAGPRAITVDLAPVDGNDGSGGTSKAGRESGRIHWTVESLSVVPRGYRAAAALAGPSIRIRCTETDTANEASRA
jgi:4'-phosphopantetheinyl transferase